MAQHNNRNSPHLSSHMNGSAPPSPSMSNAQQQGGQARQSVGYPSPTTSYPSPSTQYNYPNQQVSPPYLAFASRASSAGSSSSFLSLPSMRSIDPLHQQQHMGAPLPPVGPPMNAGYYGPPHPSQYQNVTSDPTGMRYALPAADARVMSGGRHKKEIKRRTKTGCLTCRKRRIKCDEQHPACRNCQKSKRECLGYDPVFKQQPGPAAIQPAPSSAPLQGGVSAMVNQNPYGHQPHMLSGYAGYDPSLSAAGSSASGSQQYDYSSAIDPALEAAAPPTPTTTSNQFSQGNRTMNELLAAGGDAPPPSTIDVSQLPPKIEEIKHLYFSIYSPGLENFLESKWYSVKGVNKLLGDNVLLAQFAMLLDQFAKTGANDPAEIKYTSSVEARTVWALATSVRAMTAGVKSSGLVPPVDDPVEATHRLAVFEALLTGQIAHHNTLTRPVAGSTDHHRLRELEFWYTLGNFITLPYESSTSAKDVDSTLASLRNLLDGRENRDVLYSIAVVRAIGHRVSEYTESDTPVHFDETDNRSKLAVAKKFIGDEASGNGTTNVIRRLCELAARSWAPKPASSPAKQA